MITSAIHSTPWYKAGAETKADPLFYVDASGRLRFRAHAGQQQALDSVARHILVLAGLQSGKTVTGPWWMAREMALCGPGDYLAAGPTFPLLMMKCLPEYEDLFERRLGWGKLYRGYPPILELNEIGRKALFGTLVDSKTRIIFGAGIKPESLESATVKAAHLDEAGQKQFLRASHEAVLGRLSIHRGRILYTTTPYVLGWLKGEVHDRARKERQLDPHKRAYELIQFSSTMNPAFPKAEFEEMRDKLPGWKFNMRYRGLFERPAGMIFDCFTRDAHLIPRFSVPGEWPRHLGIDFGGVNTAGVFVAREPGTKRYVMYREYKAGSRTAREHHVAMKQGEPRQPKAVGGSWSEDNWRDEFAAAGLPVSRPPIKDVEVGIDRLYSMFKNHPSLDGRPEPSGEIDDSGAPVLIQHDPRRPYLEIMEDLDDTIDEVESYGRELDKEDEPTEKIEDKKRYHRVDALRYFASDANEEEQDWSKARRYSSDPRSKANPSILR